MSDISAFIGFVDKRTNSTLGISGFFAIIEIVLTPFSSVSVEAFPLLSVSPTDCQLFLDGFNAEFTTILLTSTLYSGYPSGVKGTIIQAFK